MKFDNLMQDLKTNKFSVKKALLLITFTVLLVYVVFNQVSVGVILTRILQVFSPFLTGLVLAFILNIFVKLFEEKIFSPLNKKNYKFWIKSRRGICITIAFLIVGLIIYALVALIVPEVMKSAEVLSKNIPSFVNDIMARVTQLLKEYKVDPKIIQELNLDWNSIATTLTGYTTGFLGSLFSATMVFTTSVVNFALSLIFAVYMLAGKEKLIGNLKAILRAFLPEKRATRISEIGTLANKIFTGFVTGQFTEAVIIGVLVYLGMVIFRFPYALLISCVIAVTGIIPIVGAYIGAFFGAFVLLMESPIMSIWFLVFIVVFQNLEGNLIYPRVVGPSVGLPGIWVMLAIFAGANLMGFVGVLMGVPTVSLIYTLLKEETKKRINRKQIIDEQEDKIQEFLEK